MNIIFSLVLRSQKREKRKTWIEVSGIAFVSMLLTMASVFLSSSLNQFQKEEIAVEDMRILLTASFAFMAAILAVLLIFMYSILSISLNEKSRYLGLLASIGATPFQRGKFIFLEMLLLGGIGILSGVGIGILCSYLVIPFPIVISDKVLGISIVLECIVILLAAILPLYDSGKRNIIELLLNKTERKSAKRSVKIPKWIYKRFGIACYFAVKNLVFYKRRYLLIGCSLICSMVLFLDGTIYLNYLDGKYQFADDRAVEHADIIIDEELQNPHHEQWEAFTKAIVSMDEIESYSLKKRIELGGVLIPGNYIKPDLKTFETYSFDESYQNPTTIYDVKGTGKRGYCMNAVLIEMDEKSFETYLERAEIKERPKDENVIPVLIEDYSYIKANQWNGLGSILNMFSEKPLSVIADAENYMVGTSPERNPISSFTEYHFQVLGTTQIKPPCFELNQNLSDNNTLFLYTTKKGFQRFLDTSKYAAKVSCSASFRLKSKVEDVSQHLVQSILTPSLEGMSKSIKLSPSALTLLKNQEDISDLKIREEESSNLIKQINALAESYGLSPETDYHYAMPYVTKVLQELENPFLLMRHMFLYGLLVFISIISSFQVMKMVLVTGRMRQKEFAVFLSLGMEKKQIGKMIGLENIFCISSFFFAGGIISSAIGWILASSWNQVQPIRFRFPYEILLIEFGFFALLIIYSVYTSYHAMKKLQLMDIIRKEFV